MTQHILGPYTQNYFGSNNTMFVTLGCNLKLHRTPAGWANRECPFLFGVMFHTDNSIV